MLEHMLHNKQRLENAIQVESFVKHLHEVVFSPNHMLGKTRVTPKVFLAY